MSPVSGGDDEQLSRLPVMPTLHLALTLLLLLTRSISAVIRPPLSLALPLPKLSNSTMAPRFRTPELVESDAYIPNFLPNSTGARKSDSEETKFCDNCSYTTQNYYAFPRKYGFNYADWQSDGVGALPFYRVRSDLQRSQARVVTVLGLFELTVGGSERPEGRSELAAALLAIKHVNQRKILGDYQLRMLTNDTKVGDFINVLTS